MEKADSLTFREYVNQLYGWWNGLSDSWKNVYHFNYLRHKEPQLMDGIVWDCREIVGFSEVGLQRLDGIVNLEASLRYAEEKVPQILFHALDTESILDYPWGYCLTRKVDNTTYSIVNLFDVEDSSGLKELRSLKTLNFYGQYGKEQPKLNVGDLINLNELEEITLDVKHSLHLQDILLLNLPSLKRIYFLTHIDAISCHCVPREYTNIIDSLTKKTKIIIELAGYMP